MNLSFSKNQQVIAYLLGFLHNLVKRPFKHNLYRRYAMSLLVTLLFLESCHNTIDPFISQLEKGKNYIVRTNDIDFTNIQAARQISNISNEYQTILEQKSITATTSNNYLCLYSQRVFCPSKNIIDQQYLAARSKVTVVKQHAHATKQKSLVSQEIVTLLTNQGYIAKGDYQVRFKEKKEGMLKAILTEISNPRFNGKPRKLPVVIEPEISSSPDKFQAPSWQAKFIHLKKNYIYVGRIGLMGGMKKGKDKLTKEEEEKEEGKTLEKEDNDLGNLKVLPVEILQRIVTSHIPQFFIKKVGIYRIFY